MQGIDLNEDLIDAETENCYGVNTDQDMIVCICFIAQSFTFGREPDFHRLRI